MTIQRLLSSRTPSRAALIALVVYGKIGVEILRRAWINLDLLWVGALTIAGGLTLGLGLRALLIG